MLQDIIPASWRRFVYALYTVAATIVGALNVGGVNTGKAVDVLAYLGIAVGAVAAGNVATKPYSETARIKLHGGNQALDDINQSIKNVGPAAGAAVADVLNKAAKKGNERGAVSLATVALVAIAVVLVLAFFGVHGHLG